MTTTCSPVIDRSFQALFRPLVKSAWDRHCKLFAATVNPADKIAHEAWYRSTLLETLKTTDTTKDLSPEQKKTVLERFAFLARGCDAKPAAAALPKSASSITVVYGWTDHQNARFNELAARAWKADQKRRKEQIAPLNDWTCTEFERVLKGPPDGREGIKGIRWPWNRVQSFDAIMEHFGVIAQDQFWMTRTSESSERRMKHQLMRFLTDLAWIEYRPSVSWEYVRKIYTQSELLPSEIEDCPAKTMRLVLGMLDSRIRKLCRDADLQPCLLPTRRPTGTTTKSQELEIMWTRFHGQSSKRWPNGHAITADNGVCECGCAIGPSGYDSTLVCYGCGAAKLPF